MIRPGISTCLPAATLLLLLADVTLFAPPRAATLSLAAAKGTPREITAFLRRRSGCSRLTNEDGDDPSQVAETVKSRFWMKCSTIEDDERRLRARYADTPGVIDVLDQGGDFDNSDN